MSSLSRTRTYNYQSNNHNSTRNNENRVPNFQHQRTTKEQLTSTHSDINNLHQLKPILNPRSFGKDILNTVNNNATIGNQSFTGVQNNNAEKRINLHATKTTRDAHTANLSLPSRRPFDLMTRQQYQTRAFQEEYKSVNSHQQLSQSTDLRHPYENKPSKNIDKAQRLADFKNYQREFYYRVPRQGFLQCDIVEWENPQAVAEYASDCLKHMSATEEQFKPTSECLAIQKDVNKKMRTILVGWLIEVHLKFKLLPETLFLTINLIDRYCEKKQILRTNFQLLGVTAMLVASKYEEIYAPEIRDFVYITDKAYTKEQILAQEYDLLRTLDFNVTSPSLYRFLERFSKIQALDDLLFNYARYLMELTLLDTRMYKWGPSLIAAASIYIAKKVLKREQPWPQIMAQQTNYDEKKVRECAKEICQILSVASSKTDYSSVYKKFSHAKFLEVSKINAPKINSEQTQ